MFRRLLLPAVLLAATLLSACDSAEERAEEHFLSGLALYEEGDVARALIELRNVFKLNASHREARMLMAEINEARGNPAGALDQYTAIVEKTPEDFEAQRAAARLAADLGDWEEAERHAEAARGLMAEDQKDPVIRAVELSVAYQRARRDRDAETARTLAEEAAALVEQAPELMLTRQIVIDDRVVQQDWEGALAALDSGLEQAPESRLLYRLRLGVLEQLNRPEEIEAQLRAMVERFPEDESLPALLVRWYVSQDRMDEAEAYLRAQIDPEDPAFETRLTLVGFIGQTRGPDAALAEIDDILAQTGDEDPNRPLYRAVRAGLVFDLGDPQGAIAELEEILETAEPSDQTRRIKISLAQMLVRTGNPVGARAQVEEVLEQDPSNVEGLKMRAAWMIEDDRPDEALVELRSALDQAPRDPEVLTLMAQAQERSGSRDLMGEMLALAVEASNNGPEASMRYAEYLVQEDRLVPAERVLVDALRLQPGHLGILEALGDIYVQLEDWGRAQGVIDELTEQDGAEAAGLADTLTARVLAGQDRQGELQSFLDRLASGEDGDDRAIASAIQLRLEQGDREGALAYLEERLAEAPDNPDLRLISAALMATEGRTEEAAGLLRGLLEEDPQNQRLWIALYNLHRATGAVDKAGEVLEEALETVPDGPNLKWAKAGELERAGDIEGAIAIYEDLYEQNSNSPVIANNLASLISSFREDDESLQRAYAIARRLRGTDVPQFQDTYGWIAARLGNHDEALEYLEPAAAALPEDPTVRYHLARTYAMAGRDADALDAYRTAQDLLEAGGHALPFSDEVAAEITRLENAAPAPAAEN